MTRSFAVVTPVRNEADNLPRLAQCMDSQTLRPLTWAIVDNGSTDDTVAIAGRLAEERPWIVVSAVEGFTRTERGAPSVAAFEHGVTLLPDCDVVVNVDADISFEPDYFERLVRAFAENEALGIASGSAFELRNGAWAQRFSTGDSVWGASRAYRRACLQDVMPLERRIGWDGIDEIRAHLTGWRTATLLDLPFRHYRREGERDGAPWRAWAARGRASHYMGYRWWYLALRALHHARREPAALAMLSGYAASVVKRRPVCPDPEVREHLRRSQRLRTLGTRRRQALGAPR